MTKKQCAVLYVDILGFSALTKGFVKGISDLDYQAYGIHTEEDKNNIVLAAKILSEFRTVLGDTMAKYPAVQICQLSDCAFVWSEDVKSHLLATHHIMWQMIQNKGILCRGGISYGEVVEVDTINKLGKTIVGDAATNAAKNESKLKGPRITMDLNFPDLIWKTFPGDLFISCIANSIFNAITSEVDLSEENEYRWYLFDDEYFDDALGKILSHKESVELTKRRLQLSNVLRFHPRMGWNTRTPEGMTQLRAGLSSMTRNGLLGVLHGMESCIIPVAGRDESHFIRANERVDKDSYFGLCQRKEFERYLSNLDL